VKIGKKTTMVFLAVLTMAGILNILYIFDLIPEFGCRIGFITVMLCSIIINSRNVIKSKKHTLSKEAGTLADNKYESKVFRVLLLGMTLIWFVTYVMVTFMK
jgi:hypothetical protein